LINTEPDNVENYHYLILCEEKAGKIDMALQLCSNAMVRFGRLPSIVKRQFLLFIEKNDIDNAVKELDGIKNYYYDIEIIAGGFLINCIMLNPNKINHFYRLLFDNLSIPEKPFPEDYQKIITVLKNKNENNALSLFERGIKYLLEFNTDKQKNTF